MPEVAVIVLVPTAMAVARPFEPVALLIVATVVVFELQVTVVVMSWVEVSEYVPVAVNCWCAPTIMLGLTGVTAMETRVAGVTVSVVEPETPATVAAIVVVPGARVVASPTLLIVAKLVADEFQVAVVVRSFVVLFE